MISFGLQPPGKLRLVLVECPKPTTIPASLSLPTLGESAGPYSHLNEADDDAWDNYVPFLLDLEDSNLGYLRHEVETQAERRHLQTLVDTGDDSASLKYVSIDDRVEARP